MGKQCPVGVLVSCAVKDPACQSYGQPYTALKGSIPLSHPNTLVRAQARECQLLVDKDLNTEINGLENPTELELVTKANEAVENTGSWPPEDNQIFIGAEFLANGGIIFDMDRLKVAKWVQTNKQVFMDNFSTTSVVKGRAVSVIAELRKVERGSKLEENSVINTQWVKPPLHRLVNQWLAHLIVCGSSTNAANKAIRDGMIFSGKRVWARRLKKEPHRCLKCQKIDTKHMAAACQSIKEVCGTCGKEHKTMDCMEDDHTKYHCANCQKMGHNSWDRMCPKFIAACEWIKNNEPESSYTFFPRDNPWTWEQRDHNANGLDVRDLPNNSRRNQSQAQNQN
jgi:hypothetical protein